MAMYKLECPRWEEDIVSRRRTLIHLPSTPTDIEPRVGDSIIAFPYRAPGPRVMIEIVEVSAVPLCESSLGDWTLLNLPADDSGVQAYRTRWDATNPDLPWETNPIVWRVVFRYLHEPAVFAQAT
jgi:hypothetical protein